MLDMMKARSRRRHCCCKKHGAQPADVHTRWRWQRYGSFGTVKQDDFATNDIQIRESKDDSIAEALQMARQRSHPENALDNKTRQECKDCMEYKAL